MSQTTGQSSKETKSTDKIKTLENQIKADATFIRKIKQSMASSKQGSFDFPSLLLEIEMQKGKKEQELKEKEESLLAHVTPLKEIQASPEAGSILEQRHKEVEKFRKAYIKKKKKEALKKGPRAVAIVEEEDRGKGLDLPALEQLFKINPKTKKKYLEKRAKAREKTRKERNKPRREFLLGGKRKTKRRRRRKKRTRKRRKKRRVRHRRRHTRRRRGGAIHAKGPTTIMGGSSQHTPRPHHPLYKPSSHGLKFV